jgi:hypothetical protein
VLGFEGTDGGWILRLQEKTPQPGMEQIPLLTWPFGMLALLHFAFWHAGLTALCLLACWPYCTFKEPLACSSFLKYQA